MARLVAQPDFESLQRVITEILNPSRYKKYRICILNYRSGWVLAAMKKISLNILCSEYCPSSKSSAHGRLSLTFINSLLSQGIKNYEQSFITKSKFSQKLGLSNLVSFTQRPARIIAQSRLSRCYICISRTFSFKTVFY